MIAALAMSACSVSGGSHPTDWSRATSASDGGGLSALISAARHEGQLNLPTGLGYEPLVNDFETRYHVTVNVLRSSSDAEQMTDAQLDVYRLAVDTADANKAEFAPYLVFYWLEIPAPLKDRKAYWYESCGGYMSVLNLSGASVNALPDLLNGPFTVEIPTDRNELVAAIVTASLGSGGSLSNLAPGVQFFETFAARGTTATPNAVFEWNYLAAGKPHFTPDSTVAAYDVQAINKHAPHPAAARLWEEYLLSDTGQNLCAQLGERPARLDAMRSDGVLDLAAAGALDPAPANAVMLTPPQMAAARAYVDAHWCRQGAC